VFQTTVLLLAFFLMVAGVMASRRHPAAAAAAPRSRSARPTVRAAKAVPAQPRAKPAAPIEWVGAAEAATTTPGEDEQLCTKLRDRYIAARFPGMFRGTADLREADHVIKVARLYFEEDKLDRAQELLELAIGLSPSAKLLRLAQLEIAFLGRDSTVFTTLARAFHAAHPDGPEWADVSRLGRAIAPGEELFGANPGERSHEHYGPWPDMPNWIQASWDLTSEVLGADFHRAISAR
jgi:hypothetical protein